MIYSQFLTTSAEGLRTLICNDHFEIYPHLLSELRKSFIDKDIVVPFIYMSLKDD